MAPSGLTVRWRPGCLSDAPIVTTPIPARLVPVPSVDDLSVRVGVGAAWWRHAASATVAVALLTTAVPAVTGVSWGPVRTTLSSVSVPTLALLVLLWVAGLMAHTVALSAALPGLSHRRALQLSLTGSAVANVLPVGGAAGMALNGSMLRSWGHDAGAFARFTVLTNVWDVGGKLLLPALTVPLVTAALPGSAGDWSHGAWTGAAAMLIVAGAGGAVLVRRRTAEVWGACLDRVAGAVSLRVRPQRPRPQVASAVVALHDACRRGAREGWRGLTAGNAAYGMLVFALLWACLSASGTATSWPVILAAFTVDRVLSLVGLTPGASGLVELGMTGCLIALGVPATSAVAGVVLYRLLTFGLEIPVGGTWLAIWWWRHLRPAVMTP